MLNDGTNSKEKKYDYTSDTQCTVPELCLPNFLEYILPYFDKFTTTDVNA